MRAGRACGEAVRAPGACGPDARAGRRAAVSRLCRAGAVRARCVGFNQGCEGRCAEEGMLARDGAGKGEGPLVLGCVSLRKCGVWFRKGGPCSPGGKSARKNEDSEKGCGLLPGGSLGPQLSVAWSMFRVCVGCGVAAVCRDPGERLDGSASLPCSSSKK